MRVSLTELVATLDPCDGRTDPDRDPGPNASNPLLLDWALIIRLGGSWVVITGVISRVTIVMTQIGGLVTPLITTHELPRTKVLGYLRP